MRSSGQVQKWECHQTDQKNDEHNFRQQVAGRFGPRRRFQEKCEEEKAEQQKDRTVTENAEEALPFLT